MRALTNIPAGRRTKWLIVVAWLFLLVVLAPLAGKLGDVQKNDAAAWLPGGAESTQVVKLQEQFNTKDTSLAVVIYERATGITPADQAKATADGAAFTKITGLSGKVTGPVAAQDGKALQILMPIKDDDAADAVDAARTIIERAPPG